MRALGCAARVATRPKKKKSSSARRVDRRPAARRCTAPPAPAGSPIRAGRSAGANTGWREPGRVAHREQPDQLVVVRLLERREAGQDDVRVAGGLVEVVVDADHALEAGEGGVEATGVGPAHHRIAGDGDQRPQLARARRGDLLRQAAQRHLAEDLGRAAHPAPPAMQLPARRLVGRAQGAHRPRHGVGEQRAAGAVEVAGEDVEDLDQPRGEGAELLRAGADTAVDRGGRRRRELAREATDRRRRNRADLGHRLGREVAATARARSRRRRRRRPARRGRRGSRRTARAPWPAAAPRRCRGGWESTRRRGRRCRCGAGRSAPRGRRGRGWHRGGRARRAPRAGCPARPTGWRRA